MLMFSIVIVLQMFIAVINENFDVAEEAKREKQASSYWETQRTGTDTSGWLRKLNPYRWVPANPVTVKVENLPSHLVLPMQKALVQDYSIPEAVERPSKIVSVNATDLQSFLTRPLATPVTRKTRRPPQCQQVFECITETFRRDGGYQL